VIEADPRHPANAGRARPRVPVQYKHRREIDRFYELPKELNARMPSSVQNLLRPGQTLNVRVSYDQKTNEILAKVIKVRVNNLHIHFPDQPLDCRISINLEMPWEGSVEELEQFDATSTKTRKPVRNKDRLSYRHGHYQIDLTQVTQTTQGPNVSDIEAIIVYEH
jgi:hypothetical protein